MTTAFNGLKTVKNYAQDGFNFFKGPTDFGNLEQFGVYEAGHPYIMMISQPNFMAKLAEKNKGTEIETIIRNFNHLVQHEFKGLDGLDDITSETLEINDGINVLQLINKVKQQSGGTVTFKLGLEKTSTPYQRYTELFLTGICDPTTNLKHYHGLIEDGTIPNPGFENEVFTFLYFVTDNTGLKVEKAFLLLAAQPTKSELSIFNATRGEHETKEVSLEMSCYPIRGAAVNELANKAIPALAVIKNRDKFNFRMIANDKTSNGDSYNLSQVK